MLIYIDTANLEEIDKASDLGILDGVTTNPSLIAKEGIERNKQIEKIAKIVKGPVSAEVVSTESKKMIEEGIVLSKIATNIVVKLPSTVDGLQACKALSDLNIKTNLTLCFQPLQALMVAKAGAFLVSPFLGRIDDIGGDGVSLIEQIRSIYDQYGFNTLLLAASIRHPLHMIQCALAGADAATVPLKVIDQFMKHPLTDIGLKQFLNDHAEQISKKS